APRPPRSPSPRTRRSPASSPTSSPASMTGVTRSARASRRWRAAARGDCAWATTRALRCPSSASCWTAWSAERRSWRGLCSYGDAESASTQLVRLALEREPHRGDQQYELAGAVSQRPYDEPGGTRRRERPQQRAAEARLLACGARIGPGALRATDQHAQ